MWVSVLRAKVKPVAGVVEVGRIRVTDQRAPREPAPGKPPRRLRRGPGSHRERVSRAKLALGVPTICLPVCLPSFAFSSFLRSFAPFCLSFAPNYLASSFPSRERFCPYPFTIVLLPFPSLRTILRLSCVHGFPSSSVVRALRFLPHSALSSLPSLFNPFSLSFLSSHRSFLSLVRSLLVPLSIYLLAAYLTT